MKGEGYKAEDVGPITPAELRALERRAALEPADAGRKKKGPPTMRRGAAPDTMRSVGVDMADPTYAELATVFAAARRYVATFRAADAVYKLDAWDAAIAAHEPNRLQFFALVDQVARKAAR